MSVNTRSNVRFLSCSISSSGCSQHTASTLKPFTSSAALCSMASVKCICIRSSSIMAILRWILGRVMAGSFEPGAGLGEMEGKGMDTLNVLPFPGALSMSILPNRSSTSLRVIDNPSPNPSCPCALLRRVNSLNMRSCSLAVMPHPVSDTQNIN